LKQPQIVFDVPIVGDPPILDLEEIGGDEGDRPSLAKCLAEFAGAHHRGIPYSDNEKYYSNLSCERTGNVSE
jgi:hypothetical protein